MKLTNKNGEANRGQVGAVQLMVNTEVVFCCLLMMRTFYRGLWLGGRLLVTRFCALVYSTHSSGGWRVAGTPFALNGARRGALGAGAFGAFRPSRPLHPPTRSLLRVVFFTQ